MTIKTPQNATTIDTISRGYGVVNRRIWLLLVPLLLNAYLWFGTQISFRPLIGNLLDTMSQLARGQAISGDMQAEYDQQVMLLSNVDMRPTLAVFNAVPLLIHYVAGGGDAPGQLTGVPLMRSLPPILNSTQRSVLEVNNLPGAALVFVLVNLVVLPVSAFYLVTIAEGVRGEPIAPNLWMRRSGRAALSLLGFQLLVGLALAVVGLPFVLVASLLAAVAPALGSLALVLLLIALFWINIYLGLAREAIVVSGIGPLRAIHASFNIVRRNLWGTLLLLGLAELISLGLGLLWSTMFGSVAGLLVAIVGSSYIGTGLAAARMAFYRERLRRWQAAAAPVTR